MMADIGKMKLPESLLLKSEKLTPDEMEIVRQHADFSVELISGTRGMTHQVVGMVAAHHERFDGSGYPRGLAGGDIPMLARMAAIGDTFDAITSDRPYAVGAAPHEAIRELYEMRNTAFQDELVEQFIQTLGPYPVGTLVELKNGEIAIVIAQNRMRRLRPKVVVLLDANKKTLASIPARDLMTETVDDEGADISIAKSLPPGAHGIDPDEFYL
jgi:HD-GYP domain-containing protein (c-di-GMP phosphodiesterase class II)